MFLQLIEMRAKMKQKMKQKMTISSLLTYLFVWFMTVQTIQGLTIENINLEVPILVPDPNTSVGLCIRTAIEMGFEDIKSEIVEYTDNTDNVTRRFTFTAHYEEIGSRTIDAVEAMNKLHPLNLKRVHDATYSKRATIGPPTDEQTNIFSDFAQVLPNIQYSYSEINEPYDATASLYFQAPPSIVGQFYAARAFMDRFNWTQAVIVYDFSNNRYRLSSNLLSAILQKESGINNTKVNVVSSMRIRSDFGEDDQAEINELPHTEARIVLLLAAVPGIRQTFCQAYHLQLQRSNFVWLLFEELPEGWASSRYDRLNTKGIREREINCTEEQLLSVSKTFIFFIKGGIREDGNSSVSNMTAQEFTDRLKTSAGGREEPCHVKAAYAYDSVWIMVKTHQEIMKENHGSLFYAKFLYLLGIGKSGPISRVARNTSFQGITGHVSYLQNDYRNNIRLGFTSIRVKHGSNTTILVGTHETAGGHLNLPPNAIEILFNGVTPSHTATYALKDYQYPKEFIIVIWLFALAGIVFTVILTTIATMCDYINSSSSSARLSVFMIDVIISFGCILCYTSLLLYGIDTQFVEKHRIVDTCYAFLCTLSFGFTLTFGALFAKTWWKYKSFSAPSAIRSQVASNISEWSLFILIAIFFLIDIIIIACWVKMSPFKMKIVNGKETALSFAIEIEQIHKCDGRYMQEFTIGMFCYKGVLIIFGVFLAWQTNSKLRDNALHSKTVSLAIYNTALVSIVGVICVGILRDTKHLHALYAIIAVCVVLCTTTTISMIYVPRISKIFGFDSSNGDSSSSSENDIGKPKFNNFTLEKLRQRVTNRSSKLPSVTSMQTSTMSISTIASTLEHRRQTASSQTELTPQDGGSVVSEPHRASSFTTESSSNVGSFVSYNPSLVQSSTVLETPTEEEEPMYDIMLDKQQNVTIDEQYDVNEQHHDNRVTVAV